MDAGRTLRADPEASSVRHYWMICLLLILMAAVLRWINLAGWDMWLDEVLTLRQVQTGDFREGPMYSTAPVNFWLTKVSVAVFGPDELGVRFSSFAAGVAAVAVFAWGFRRWIGDMATILGTLLLAIDPWHVGWSQTGRHFAPQMLFILVGVLLFMKGWVDRRPAFIWGSAAFLLAAIFTHSSSTFFVATFLLFLGVGWLRAGSGGGRPRRDYVTAAIPIAIPLLLYMPVFFGIGTYLLGHKTPWNPPWNIIGSLAFYIMPPMFCAAVAGTIILWRERREWWLLLPLLVAVPSALILISSMFTIASAAYLLALLPMVVALAALALARLLRWADAQGFLWAGIALVMGVVLSRGYELAHYYTVYNGFKARWEDATAYVLEHRKQGEPFYASEGNVPGFYAGLGTAEWISDETMARAPEPGAWYAVYSAGVPFRHDVSPRYREISRVADLMEFFPVHYGAKDRTIAVFHTPSSISDPE